MLGCAGEERFDEYEHLNQNIGRAR